MDFEALDLAIYNTVEKKRDIFTNAAHKHLRRLLDEREPKSQKQKAIDEKIETLSAFLDSIGKYNATVPGHLYYDHFISFYVLIQSFFNTDDEDTEAFIIFKLKQMLKDGKICDMHKTIKQADSYTNKPSAIFNPMEHRLAEHPFVRAFLFHN